MDNLKKSLSRQTENFTKSRDLYLGPNQLTYNTKPKSSSQVDY